MHDTAPGENRRQIFRVLLAGAGVRATIGNVPDCYLLDAHSEGFGAMVPGREPPWLIGQTVTVRVEYAGVTGCGRATVRNGLHRNGRWRYGFAVQDDDRSLRRALREIAIRVQRKRLSRMAERT